jgi:hypothetical protein
MSPHQHDPESESEHEDELEVRSQRCNALSAGGGGCRRPVCVGGAWPSIRRTAVLRR